MAREKVCARIWSDEMQKKIVDFILFYFDDFLFIYFDDLIFFFFLMI